jgi:aspartyl-tRNA(Asn)/glutamyl-tRNA(Gln) amidotransferase subunit B
MEYEPVIGLEVHAELLTRTKMFCSCPVVDSTVAEPNISVCPVCLGLPGALPVVNRQAVEYALRVALALGCQVNETSIFDRKNYFYPDLPKGYQISQFEHPLAEHGLLPIQTSQGRRDIHIRRVHMEEDAGKLTHVESADGDYTLVDLNRAGVALLEIVSEPDLFSVEEVRAYATELRSLIRCVGVNSGDMQKGVIRFEANVSIRPSGSPTLGTRVEIKNLNSFRALERSVIYQIEQQKKILDGGGSVEQETLGWDEAAGKTYSMRSKEEAHDYRYFPEPDLPPLVVEGEWVQRVAAELPELPFARRVRYQHDFGLSESDARMMADEPPLAEYFELAVSEANQAGLPTQAIVNWITGELFGWMNQSGQSILDLKVNPVMLVELASMNARGDINLNTAKTVLTEMLKTGRKAREIAKERGLQQISDTALIADLIAKVLADHPAELASYVAGKETLSNWFFGQVMKSARGQGNPQVIRAELDRQLKEKQAGK